jgi:hypothetical protein
MIMHQKSLAENNAQRSVEQGKGKQALAQSSEQNKENISQRKKRSPEA